MNSKTNSHRHHLVAGAIVAVVAIGLTGCASGASTSSSGKQTIAMATEPWIGYGPWWIAKKEGYFGKNDLSVDQTTFNADADLNAAFASGKVNVANVATHTALRMAASGIPMKIIMTEDESITADSILAPASITTIKQLKGKSIAYEKGTTSDLLLNYALQLNKMTINDVQPVPVDASDAGSALIAGKVDAAVTYEPYITTALDQKSGFHRLFTAGKEPGLISDVLVVRTDYAKANPKALKNLVKSWGAAINYYNAHTTSARAIISKAVGSNPKDLDTAFNGVKLYSLTQNQTDFGSSFSKQTVPLVMKAAISAGILSAPVKTTGLFDSEYLH